MTQQEALVILQIQAELDADLLRLLTSIKVTGSIRNKTLDLLMSRGLIHPHGSDDYRHFRLTTAGDLLVKKLKQTQDMTRHVRS